MSVSHFVEAFPYKSESSFGTPPLFNINERNRRNQRVQIPAEDESHVSIRAAYSTFFWMHTLYGLFIIVTRGTLNPICVTETSGTAVSLGLVLFFSRNIPPETREGQKLAGLFVFQTLSGLALLLFRLLSWRAAGSGHETKSIFVVSIMYLVWGFHGLLALCKSLRKKRIEF